ncbi:ABC transporter permease [Clostridium sp. CCUG 7971]|uniref:ABC transporter permease n=1 Tax=Clostridium sp. CCUG 7971 TaxID=2811414 RepID=UPI001ABAD09C|nr:ABC transporter permease [Clostridium sp. CCUG 7971]MBO3443365.1 ABC transporter permease [Clostridium sp. CCUG 7971]
MMEEAVKVKNPPVIEKSKKIKFGVRERTISLIAFCTLVILTTLIIGSNVNDMDLAVNFSKKNLAPSINHLFGTDWMGRDMFARTMKGITLSIKIGLLSSFLSGIMALILGIMSATCGKIVDSIISWFVDLVLSVPHILLIILICFAVGGGLKGVVIGVALTHWPSLARLIRSEVMQIKSSEYVKISKNFGKSNIYIAKKHILPHILPQLLVGTLLIFPHAVLHEASITFLGFGLSPHEPAIGIILSESMKYLSTGYWWLAFFPGLVLLIASMMVDTTGQNLRKLIDPKTAYK